MSQALMDALALIEARGPAPLPGPVSREPLPSLMDRVDAAVAGAPEPVRLLHHFACTGGTLIARALSVMPNVTLLSEIDPLSRMGLPKPGTKPPFRPLDLIFAGRVVLRPIDDAQAAAIFTAGLSALRASLIERGQHLVLRDHPHSQFCTDADWRTRPTLAALVARVAPVRAAITVRHPMESFLSLRANGYMTFAPDTLHAYAQRYSAFLDAHDGTPILRYEDFVADPDPVLKRLCRMLELPYRAGALAGLEAARLSGDSGRRGRTIMPRPRKPVPGDLAKEARASAAYASLCARLGYEGD